MDTIMVIKVFGRVANAPLVQEILTEYGCSIKTRVGFHEASADRCSTDGMIILQLTGPAEETKAMFNKLNQLEGVVPKMLEF